MPSPVVPDVYRIYKGSLASTGTHGWGSEFSITESQDTSKSRSNSAISMFFLWKIIHFFGLWEA